MSAPVLSIKEIVDVICGDGSLRRVAAAAIKEEVDDIYGYSKYDLNEIDWSMEDRLYFMAYLAKAIVVIIEQPKIDLELKKTLCSSYLQLLVPGVKGELPRAVYRWGFEPCFTVEMAVFLDTFGELDWRNFELLEEIVAFGAESSVESKARFLENFVARLNRDEDMFKHFTSPKEGVEDWEVSELAHFDHFFFTPKTREEISPSTLCLLENLSMIMCSSGRKNVPLKPLGKLKCVTNADITWMLDHLILFRIPNGVKASEELYEMLLERGEDPKALLHSLLSRMEAKCKISYHKERKVRGFYRAISKLPGDKSRFITLTKRLLDAKMGADAKLSAYKFLYRETNDRELLEKARDEGTMKIREWAVKALKSRP